MNKMLERFNLLGKTALITGSAGLLGFQHAAALLEIGADVVLTDIDKIKLETTKQQLSLLYPERKILSLEMDVTNSLSIEQTSQYLLSKEIKVQILINNAAIDPKVGNNQKILEGSRLENFLLEQWNLEIAVGLTGAFLCSKIFGTLMVQNQSSGVIINIASDLSVISPDQRLYRKSDLSEEMQPVKPVTYSVIKAGLVGLTRYLATYWADKNIRCNALSPGGVFNNQNQGFVEKLSSLIPLGRMAYPDEYRSALQFLCSDASSYMNGQNLVIDGGRSVW